jgi:hypothetical protein
MASRILAGTWRLRCCLLLEAACPLAPSSKDALLTVARGRRSGICTATSAQWSKGATSAARGGCTACTSTAETGLGLEVAALPGRLWQMLVLGLVAAARPGRLPHHPLWRQAR